MKLAVFGASGHGKVVASTALRAGWKVIEFYDDAWPARTHHCHWPVIGDTKSMRENMVKYDGWVVAIGDNRTRLRKINDFKASAAPLISLVDPAAVVSDYASVGAGSVIAANAVVQVDCELGVGCIVNTGATVDHDCKLLDGVHVSPGANLAGGVKVGECAWIGIGAAVKQLICIGDDAIVGVGASVIRDIAAGMTVVGTPAKPIIRRI